MSAMNTIRVAAAGALILLAAGCAVSPPAGTTTAPAASNTPTPTLIAAPEPSDDFPLPGESTAPSAPDSADVTGQPADAQVAGQLMPHFMAYYAAINQVLQAGGQGGHVTKIAAELDDLHARILRGDIQQSPGGLVGRAVVHVGDLELVGQGIDGRAQLLHAAEDEAARETILDTMTTAVVHGVTGFAPLPSPRIAGVVLGADDASEPSPGT